MTNIHMAATSPEGSEWDLLYCIQWKQITEDKKEKQSEMFNVAKKKESFEAMW